jgi:hypothetical protein
LDNGRVIRPRPGDFNFEPGEPLRHMGNCGIDRAKDTFLVTFPGCSEDVEYCLILAERVIDDLLIFALLGAWAVCPHKAVP